MNLRSCPSGFTLIEALLALGILAVLASVIASGTANFRESSALGQAVDEAIGMLREARARALGAEGGTVAGVHFASSSITRFRGATYLAGAPGNVVFALPGSLEISAITLSTTTGSVAFRRLTGEAAATGTITFLGKRSGRTQSVRIIDSGAVAVVPGP